MFCVSDPEGIQSQSELIFFYGLALSSEQTAKHYKMWKCLMALWNAHTVRFICNQCNVLLKGFKSE